MKQINNAEDILDIVCECGFLPFFGNDIQGFSIEDMIVPELWFSSELDGPWEWKGPIARSGKCVYGKFFGGKAGFISLDMFPDFANYRRDGYDYEGFYEDGKANYKDKDIYDAITSHGRSGLCFKKSKIPMYFDFSFSGGGICFSDTDFFYQFMNKFK